MKKNILKDKLGIFIIILFSLSSVTKMLITECKIDKELIDHDSISMYERRFEGIKKSLPSHGVVGYLTDTRSEEVLKRADSGGQLMLTQYALSPVVVENSLEHEFIVGNFHKPNMNITLPVDKDIAVIKDFRNGIILFKNKGSR